MEYILDAFGWLFRSIGWLIEQRSRGELPGWVIPLLILPVGIGPVVGWLQGNSVFLALFYGALGFLLSVGILYVLVNMRQVARGYLKESAMQAMTDEQLLRIWTGGARPGWTDEDFGAVEDTLRARGVEVPERK